jgi:hypothetical protein
MKNVDWSNLSKEQQDALREQFLAEEKAKQDKIINERKVYKGLRSDAINRVFPLIMKANTELAIVKGRVFREFQTLVEMKGDLYEVDPEQRSHTFINEDKDKRVRIGYRVYSKYDDTVDAGIKKMYEAFDDTSSSSPEAKKMKKALNILLKRDKDDNLDPGRVIELEKMAQELESDKFNDGLKIVKDAHYLEKSAYYVEAEYKNDEGKWVRIILNVSAVDFPEADKKILFPDEEPVKATEEKK